MFNRGGGGYSNGAGALALDVVVRACKRRETRFDSGYETYVLDLQT